MPKGNDGRVRLFDQARGTAGAVGFPEGKALVSDFEEDDSAEVKRRSAALLAARARREQIIELFQFRRRCGEPLSDVAIAVRVGCSPSDVAKVREELQQGEQT